VWLILGDNGTTTDISDTFSPTIAELLY